MTKGALAGGPGLGSSPRSCGGLSPLGTRLRSCEKRDPGFLEDCFWNLQPGLGIAHEVQLGGVCTGAWEDVVTCAINVLVEGESLGERRD